MVASVRDAAVETSAFLWVKPLTVAWLPVKHVYLNIHNFLSPSFSSGPNGARSPAVGRVSDPELLHDEVVAWIQQVRKAVQSVSEHTGSEYNSIVQQISRTKVGTNQKGRCTRVLSQALGYRNSVRIGVFTPHSFSNT